MKIIELYHSVIYIMKCAVIGGKGYIGKHLVFYLRSRGAKVFSYDIADAREEDYYCIDITDPDSVSKIDFDVDYVFMFAGLTGTHAGFENFKAYNAINELGLTYLLDAIRKSPFRPKVVFPSTRLVYKGADRPLKETDEMECKTIYAVNKVACEGLLQAYSFSFDIPYTIFRVCVPYGNMLSADYSFGTIGFFIKQASSGKDITLYGDGSIKRTFTHMADLCFQIVEGASTEESNDQVYNVGGETLSLRQAAEIIASRYGVNVVSIPWPEKDLRIESNHTFFDDSKIQSMLGGITYKRLVDFSMDL